MISTPDPPPPDPEIKAQQIQADAARTREIQSGTGEDSLNLARMFGLPMAGSYSGLGALPSIGGPAPSFFLGSSAATGR